MTNILKAYKKLNIQSFLNEADKNWIEKTISNYRDGEISIKQMWALLDQIWNLYNCDDKEIDERIANFYKHPVWLLNGIHIESDQLSLSNRIEICNWINEKSIKRIADFGGGFGSLARLIAENCNDCEVEVIDPYPHYIGRKLSEKYPNLKYVEQLNGKYELIIATDVFEHVEDPLRMVEETSRHLVIGGQYLIGNCFEPVIKCHLPSTFHFRGSWSRILTTLGLRYVENINYIQVFTRDDHLNLPEARKLESKSRLIYRYTKFLPAKMRVILTPLFL
jgi:2-polyprenyl-3-methyl-5-hydroxy-6-metoxy-1,4-benzoquinol methylase